MNINESEIIRALDQYASKATANQLIPGTQVTPSTPSWEDKVQYMLWAESCARSIVRRSLCTAARKTQLFRADPKYSTLVRKLEKAESDAYSALADLADFYRNRGAAKPEGSVQTRDNVLGIMETTVETLVQLEPERIDEFACLMDNFQASELRLLDTGVYSVIEQFPDSANDRARSLIDLHCKNKKLTAAEREHLATAVTQLAVYERETWVNAQFFNTQAIIDWIAQHDSAALPETIPASVVYQD